MTKLLATAFVICALLALAALASGASWVEAALPGGLPIGNALAALVPCALAAAALALSTRGTWLRVASVVAVMAALAWLPVSIALAGNLALNFSGVRGEAWVVFSLAIYGWVLATLAWALGAALWARLRRVGGRGLSSRR